MASVIHPENVTGVTQFNNSITNALLAKKVFEDEQAAIKFAEQKGYDARNRTSEELLKFYVDEVFGKLNNSDLVNDLRLVLPKKDYLEAASNSLKISKSTPPELSELSKAIGTATAKKDYHIAQKVGEVAGGAKSLLFGKTGGFIATHMVGIAAASMTGGMSIALTANPIVSYAIYNAVKSTAFAVLEETGILGAVRNAFSSFLQKVSKALGFDKFFEEHPKVAKAAKCVALGVAAAAAIAATSSLAGAAEFASENTDKVMDAITERAANIEIPANKDEAIASLSNLLNVEGDSIQDIVSAEATNDSVINNLEPDLEPDNMATPDKPESEFLSKMYSEMEADGVVPESFKEGAFEAPQQQIEVPYSEPQGAEVAEPTSDASQELKPTEQVAPAITEIEASDIEANTIGEVELPIEHSIWRTFETHLESKGIEFASEAEKDKAMVHLMQEVGRLNPDITDIDVVREGQVVKFPDLADLESATTLAESIEVTPENNVLAKGSYHKGLMEAAKEAQEQAGVTVDVPTNTAVPVRDFEEASPLIGGAMKWGTIDAEQYEILTNGEDFHFLGIGEDTYPEKLDRIATALVDHKAGDTLSPTERAYAIEQVGAMLENKNSISNMDAETFRIPANLNEQHLNVMAQDMDNVFVGNYIMENAKTSTEARYHFDVTGHLKAPSGTTIEDVAETITREMARSKGLEGAEVGALYNDIVESIKVENGVSLDANNAAPEDISLPEDLRQSALNQRYLKQGNGFGRMRP